MTHGSLYSGIGGWLLAAEWAKIKNIFTVEIDKFCNKVLKKHFEVEQYRDIKEFNGTKYRGAIDIISTSDPCQPFSFAGKRGGKADDRFLWPQTIRVIREIRPSYVVFENVFGFISMAFEIVASDLEAEGYTVESFIIPACAVGAWHRRNRLWVIAYSTRVRWGTERKGIFTTNGTNWNMEDISNTTEQGLQNRRRPSMEKHERTEQEPKRQGCTRPRIQTISDTDKSGFKTGQGWEITGSTEQSPWRNAKNGRIWQSEPGICRVAHGISNRVDRLKSLGNAIVPQIAFLIFEAIKDYEIHRNDT